MHIFHRCQTVLTTAALLVFLCAPAWAQSPAPAQPSTRASSSCHPNADSVSATTAKDTLKSEPVLQSLPLTDAASSASANSCIGTSQICLPEGTQRCCGTLRCQLPNGKPPYRCLP